MWEPIDHYFKGIALSAIEPMGRRERKKQALREKIHTQTIGLISQRGINGVTIEAICDLVDIAKKTFYNYYASKNELLNDICQVQLLDYVQLIITEAQAAESALDLQLDFVFKVMSHGDFDVDAVQKELMGYLSYSLSTPVDDGVGTVQFLNQAFFKLFDDGREALKPGMSPNFCAEMTVGMVFSIGLNWTHYTDYDASSRFTQLSEFVRKSMLA